MRLIHAAFGTLGVAIATLAAVGPASASSTCVIVGTPSNYSLYSGGAAAIGGGSALAVTSGGPVAFGGGVSLYDATLANAASATASQLTLVSGAGISVTSPATLAEGSGEYVGSISGGTISTPGGGSVSGVMTSALPFSFSTTSTALQSTATALAGESPAGSVGTTSTIGSTLTLLGAASGVNYFTLPSLTGITTIVVNLSGGGVGVVNLGSGSTTLSGISVSVAAGTSASNVLFNTTGSLTLNNDTFDASALAKGTISADGDTLNGSLFAAGSLTVYKSTQTYTLFNGCGPGFAVPESPSLPFLPIVAIGVVGSGVAWRYHRQRVLGALRY